MAGGEGRRLNLGEKPLVKICGRPMIASVIDAFREAGHDIVVALSERTPYTQNWCRVQGVDFVVAEGKGYVRDLVDVVLILGEEKPLFTCVADLPCITAPLIARISDAYRDAGKDACSVWVPLALCGEKSDRSVYMEIIDGIEAVPAGINVLRGDRIREPQEEFAFLCKDSRLTYQVNTREDLAKVERSLLMRGVPTRLE